MSDPLTNRFAQLARRFGERVGLRDAPVADAEKDVAACHPCEGRADRLAAACAAAGLPESLLQAFAATPLAAGDGRFVGRAGARERLLACLDAWREQRPAMMAVVGPQGCGVTSLLRQTVIVAPRHEYDFLVRLTIKAYVIDVRLERALASDVAERFLGALGERGLLPRPMVAGETATPQSNDQV